MIRRKNPKLSASRFAGSAFRELSDMKRALQSAEASLAHLNHGLRVPSIKPKRTRTARTVSRPPAFLSLAAATAGDTFLDNFSGELGGNGIRQSSTQFAARLFDAAIRGQRLR